MQINRHIECVSRLQKRREARMIEKLAIRCAIDHQTFEP